MSHGLTFSARVVSGALVLGEKTKAELLAGVKRMKDGVVTLTIERKRVKHSDAQRAYWWAVIVKLGAETTGYSEDEFHELAKALHLDKQAAAEGKNGRILGEYVIGGSITKLSVGEMAELITRTREWMAGALECRTPDPDPNWKNSEEAA